MKVLLIIGPGANQKALACKLHQVVKLEHVAHIEIKTRKKSKFLTGVASVTLGLPLRLAWNSMMAHFERRYPSYPDVNQSHHMGVNSSTMLEIVRIINPDLTLVSGTDLLKKDLISILGPHTMNLHTGISPYIKGSPNSTNWALALNEFDLIGNTIMWLDQGIDTGEIIATERTPLTGSETLEQLHIAVMDHAHDLYCRALRLYAAGHKLNAVRQSTIEGGRLFLNNQWTATQILKAMYNYTVNFKKNIHIKREIKLIKILKD